MATVKVHPQITNSLGLSKGFGTYSRIYGALLSTRVLSSEQ